MVYWTISAKMMAETYFCPANRNWKAAETAYPA